MKRRELLIGMSALAGSNLFMTTGTQATREKLWSQPEPWAEKLIAAAESQIGITTIYDPAYVGLSFPGGDIPRQRGVCTDVVIRAYRDALDYDLQAEVNKDMRAHFSAYPKIWGLKRTDRNIDHRRVPNLRTFFKRQGSALPVSDQVGDYLSGDIVSQMLPGNLPHMAIVTHRLSPDGKRPMLVHNIGAGTRLEDRLFAFEITGHYRFRPSAKG
ncbi:hypothetical protein LP7551_00749 [Roseibium album]|nr:hypothetical protein LP7551_00749 [Roseibium album]